MIPIDRDDRAYAYTWIAACWLLIGVLCYMAAELVGRVWSWVGLTMEVMP